MSKVPRATRPGTSGAVCSWAVAGWSAALDRRTGLLLLALQLACLWPVWRWTAARLGDGSGEGAAIVACALALLVKPRDGGAPAEAPGRVPPLGVAAALTVAYALAAPLAPPVLGAALGYTALVASWSAWRDGQAPRLPAVAIVLLALPALPTVQYVAGAPLRMAAGEIAVILLGAVGVATHREGVALVFAHRLVAIDAPCSGLYMAWAALLLAAALALLGRLSAPCSGLLLAAAATLAVLANGLRAAALTFVETPGLLADDAGFSQPGGLAAAGDSDSTASLAASIGTTVTLAQVEQILPGLPVHDAIGLVCFALAAAPLPWLARRWRMAPPETGSTARERPASTRATVAFLLACLLAAASGLAERPSRPRATIHHDWPTTFAGRALISLPLNARDRRFAEGFPGEIQSFALRAPAGAPSPTESTQLLLRWVDRPTRLLHPAGECLRATGWTVAPAPLERDAKGTLWSVTLARRGESRLVVRERIDAAAHRETFTDASSWYWAALLGRTEGPWLAWTVIEPQPALGQ